MSTPPSDDAEATISLESPLSSPFGKRSRPYLLEQVQGPGAPRQFVLELDEVVIGRSLQAHITLDSSLLSRRHVALKRTGPEYTCVDLGSTNGFYVNGVKAHSAVLHEGDALQMGDVVLLYREGS